MRREGMPEVDETPKVKVLREVDEPRLLIVITYQSGTSIADD